MKKYELEANDKNIQESLINDKLGNQEYLSSIIRLLSNINENEVICVDGDWGVGKTFLIKQLMYLIMNYNKDDNQEQFRIIDKEKEILSNLCVNNLVFYYNAWENDNHSDVLESIIYNILNVYPKYKHEVISKCNKEEFVKDVMNLLTKIASNKLLSVDLSAEKVDKIKTFNDLSNEINTYEERKESFEKLINKIIVDKRMILIIDELDRCNPNYATKILEVIKHFYNLSNVTVIIVANNRELQNTIKKQYGQSFNAYSYLNKFYDYVITIDNNRSVKYSKSFLNFRTSTFLAHDVFYAMIEKYKFSIRDCNRYRVLYDTAVEYIENQYKRDIYLDNKEEMCIRGIIIPIIFSFKIKDIDAYDECLNGETKKLKETIIYLNEIFSKNGHKGWLLDFVNIEKGIEEITAEEIAQKIADVFIEIYNSEGSNKYFLNTIRASL